VKKHLKKAVKWSWYSFAAVVIITAVLIGATRLLTPVFNRHMPDFEVWASQNFQTPVKIEDAYFSWSGYEPGLTLEHVTILNKTTQKPVINIQKMHLNLNIFKTLWHRKLSLESINIQGVHFIVREEAGNKFNIAGLYHVMLNDSLTGAAVKTNEVFAWISSQPKLSLHDIDVRIIFANGIQHTVLFDKLIVKNDGLSHTLKGDVVLQQELPTEAKLYSHWYGKVDDLAHASIAIDLTLEGVSLLQWLQEQSWHGWKIQQGVGSTKIAAQWKENQWQSVECQLQLYDLTLFSNKTKQTRNIARASGTLNWSREKENQVFSGYDILIDLPNHLWPTLDFTTTFDSQLNLKKIAVSYLDLTDAYDWLSAGKLLPENISFKPRGEVRNFQLDLPVHEAITTENIILATDFSHVSFDAFKEYPEIQNISGYLNWSGKQGELQLNSQNTTLVYPKFFEYPLRFDSVSGKLSLKKNIISAQNLRFINADIETTSNFSGDFSNKSLAKINLSSEYSVLHAENLTHYLPMKVMKDKMVHWVKQAFDGGQLQSGKASINNGKVMVSGSAKDLEMHYAPNWPMIHKLNGTYVLAGKILTINAASGIISNASIKQVRATIQNVGAPAPSVMQFDGLIQGDLANGIDFIHKSPLEKTLGKNLTGINFSGDMQLKISMMAPFAKIDNTKLKAEVVIADGKVMMNDWDFELTKMKGGFGFSESEIKSGKFTADLLGEPVTLSFSGKQKSVQALLLGQITIPELQNWLDIPLNKVLQGAAKYQVHLELPADEKTPAQLTLQSNLSGVTVMAPMPFAKPGNLSRDFKLQLFMKREQPLKSKLNYGNLLSGAFTNDKKGVGGEIRLGSLDAQWQKNPGIIITGKMDQVDWPIWKDYFASFSTNKHHLTPSSGIDTKLWRSVDIMVNKLTLLDFELNKIRIQLTTADAYWQLGLTNSNMEGKIYWPEQSSPAEGLHADFQRLYLPSGMSGEKINPKTIAPLVFTGADVHYGDKRLGRIELTSIPNLTGMSIKNLKISSPSLRLSAKGDWHLSGKQYQTNLQGTIETTQLSNLLRDWGFSASNLVGRNASVGFNLQWADAPYSPTSAGLSGNVAMKIGPGRIINLSSSNEAQMGLGRMLSIFSLQEIPRRLSLDFSDVFEKGFSFDAIAADFSLKNGNAYTNDLDLNGPIAKVTINGRIGLQNKDYDFLMIVTPYVTSSLPVVATVATGFNPIAGLAALAVEKIIGGGVSKVVSYHYRVTGPWSNPNWAKV